MSNTRLLPSGRWSVQVRLKGFTPISKTFPTEQEAAAWGDAEEARLLAARSNALSQPDRPPTPTTVVELVQIYLQSAQALSKSKGSVEAEKRRSVAIVRLLGPISLQHIDIATVQTRFIDARLRQTSKRTHDPIAPATVRAERTLLSTIFRFATRLGLLKTNPLADGRALFSPQVLPRTDYLSEPELANLLAASETFDHPLHNPSFHPWLLLVVFTGLRPGEAARLPLDSFRTTHLLIRPAHHKNKRPRQVLLPHNLQNLLQAQHAYASTLGSPYLFPSRTRPSSPLAHSHPFRQLVKRAGINRPVVPHLLRHSFITSLTTDTHLADGNIALLAGHSSVSSLKPYRHALPLDLKDTFEKFAEHRINRLYSVVGKLIGEGNSLDVPPSPDLIPTTPDAYRK